MAATFRPRPQPAPQLTAEDRYQAALGKARLRVAAYETQAARADRLGPGRGDAWRARAARARRVLAALEREEG